ncbi:MAG: hypothetical protein FWF87_04255 [Synergistaceae bacterium]|nr:hypothetical protein [Synergistaceae bacterium]
METHICPFCKGSITGIAKKCSGCGRKLPVKTGARMSRKKAISIAAVALMIIAAALYAANRISAPDNPLSERNASEETREKVTLKDYFAVEFTPDDILLKFNTFMQNASADSLLIKELVLESGTKEDTYHNINNNENISFSITARKESKIVTSVSISARGDKGTTDFMAYCFAMMDIFTPVMKANVRQKVIYEMVGYEEGANKLLADKNTYIIGETKYIYNNDEQKGLSLHIEQMPELEIYRGAPPNPH